MGREWYLSWLNKSSSKKRAATGGGCMNAMLHLFDFHHFHLRFHPTTNTRTFVPNQPKPGSLNGVQAPRKSLASLEEMVNEPTSSASIIKDEKHGSSPFLKGSRRDTKLKSVQAPRGKNEDYLTQSSCSPASARTPNLVARLMGLDILPESNITTPRSSSSQPLSSPHVSSTPPLNRSRKNTRRGSYDNNVVCPPESPLRKNRRRSTDVSDQHPRLSLEVNKKKSIVKEMESSRPSCSAISTKLRREGKRYEEESTSPGYYARQVMKQVRQTVGSRVGVDITNTVGQRHREHRKDEHLLTRKKSTPDDNSSHFSDSKVILSKQSALREAFLDPVDVVSSTVMLGVVVNEDQKQNKHQQKQQHSFDKLEQKSKKLLDTKGQFGRRENVCHGNSVTRKFNYSDFQEKHFLLDQTRPKSCSKKHLKSMDSIRSKKEGQFLRPPMNKKPKNMPFSSDLLHDSVPSNQKQGSSSKVGPLKSLTSITETQLSRIPSQAERSKGESWAMEFQYISRIMKSTGLDKNAPVSFTKWFSSSHPLSPSIFHGLEAAHHVTSCTTTTRNPLDLVTNRKLIFHLVDEILADILKPYLQFPSRQDSHLGHHRQQINGFQLVKLLCMRIRSYPSVDCQSLEDIDGLVEKHLATSKPQSISVVIEEEGEAIVSEIGHDIVDALIQEIVVHCLGSYSSSIKR